MDKNDSKLDFAFQKENYIILVISLVVVIIGFLLMIGGKPEDPNVFNEEVFSFRRITIAPVVVLLGFVGCIVAIMKKPKEETTEEDNK